MVKSKSLDRTRLEKLTEFDNLQPHIYLSLTAIYLSICEVLRKKISWNILFIKINAKQGKGQGQKQLICSHQYVHLCVNLMKIS